MSTATEKRADFTIRSPSTTEPEDSNRVPVFSNPAASGPDGGPVPSGPYFVRIQAMNACGFSAPSPEVSAVVP